MPKKGTISNLKMEEVSGNDGFVDDEEDDEVDIDDEFEDIKEGLEENNDSGSNDMGV